MELFLTLILGFVWYQIIAHVGISMGLHRFYAHKQFKLPNWLQVIVLYMATLAGARSPIGWIAAHRMHHAYSDTEDDPHSPKYKGFWTVFLSQWNIENIPARFSKDLMQNKNLLFFHKYWKVIWLVSAAMAALIGVYFFIGFIVMPMILAMFGFGMVNALCHSADGEAIDNLWVNVLTAGEGYHLQHHLSGSKYRLGKYDTTGILIDILIRIGFINRRPM